jgi:4-hydroxy-tetrahydrodipicolinate synthase
VRYSDRTEAKAWAYEAFRGAVVSTIPTPYKKNLEVDEKGLRALAQYAIEVESDALFITGNVGEFFSLTVPERKQICETVVDEVNGRIPVIVQTASHCAKDCIELSLHAQEAGADLVSIIQPYFQAKTEQAIEEWLKFVAKDLEIGIIFYDSPLASLVSSEFIAKISQEIPNIVGVKDGRPELMWCRDTEKACDNRIWVSCPLEDHWLYSLMIMKNPVLCCCWQPYLFQTPKSKLLRQYTDLALKGEFDKAAQVSAQLDPLRKILNTIFWNKYKNGLYCVAHFKYWLELIGLPGGPVRPPLLQITEQEKRWLRDQLKSAGPIGGYRDTAAA